MSGLERRRDTRVEGLRVLFWLIATIAGLGVFQFFFFRWWSESPVFATAFVTIEVVYSIVVIVYAGVNIVANQQFICRIDDRIIESVSPVTGCGQSFKLEIADITHTEKEDWGDSYRWYIWDKLGNRYWLTSNYHNPADQFIDLLKALNPNVTENRASRGVPERS